MPELSDTHSLPAEIVPAASQSMIEPPSKHSSDSPFLSPSAAEPHPPPVAQRAPCRYAADESRTDAQRAEGFRLRGALALTFGIALCGVVGLVGLKGHKLGSRGVSLLGGEGLKADGVSIHGKALKDVEAMYRQDPTFVKDWALLTGRQGQALLHQLKGPQQSLKASEVQMHKFARLDSDVQQLTQAEEEADGEDSSGVIEDDETPEQKARKKILREHANEVINRRTAWLMVQDLSQNWDKNSNYSKTPWEFCASRNLSPRQIRECTDHLIYAAGAKAHRDLNLNARIYDRYCAGMEHTFLDKHGSPLPLPRGAADMCVKAVTARSNVDMLLKRQVTVYRTHKDQQGREIPAKREIQGSHGINCKEIPEGCR